MEIDRTVNHTKEQIILLAKKVANYILADSCYMAIWSLKPVLDSRCPFSKLDCLGKEIGQLGSGQKEKFFKAFDEIINYNAMGGFVIVSKALIYFIKDEFETVMRKSREYIIKGDAWYVCDIIGERSLGYALINYFDRTLPWLKQFFEDENKWVKRSAGVSIHFFSKRVLDELEKTKKLLSLLEPYIEEKQIDVVKGIGWALKTIGRYHPDMLMEFLRRQLKAKKRISKLMVKKAITYLGDDKKSELENYVQSL